MRAVEETRGVEPRLGAGGGRGIADESAWRLLRLPNLLCR